MLVWGDAELGLLLVLPCRNELNSTNSSILCATGQTPQQFQDSVGHRDYLLDHMDCAL